MNNEIQVMSPSAPVARQGFDFAGSLEIAKILSQSKIIPAQFQNAPADVLIALNLAHRLNADPFHVMQSMYVVHGKPSFSGQFYIACINSCGRYAPVSYDEKTDENGKVIAVRLITTEMRTKTKITGPWVSLDMAAKEGWLKNNPKWTTMPELMLRYRAAAFFVRTYCPDITMGVPVEGESEDIQATVIPSNRFLYEDRLLAADSNEALMAISTKIKNDTTLTDSDRKALRASFKKKSDVLAENK